MSVNTAATTRLTRMPLANASRAAVASNSPA